jgi:hypothetical protein
MAMRTPNDSSTDLLPNELSPTIEGSSELGAGTFNHPEQVVSAAELTKSQKRMLLASWASDRRAVENAPALRQLDSGAVVSIDDILEAMTALDGQEEPARPGTSRRFDLGRTSRLTSKLMRRRVPWADRDDDPPPTAAAAARPFSPTFTEALALSA